MAKTRRQRHVERLLRAADKWDLEASLQEKTTCGVRRMVLYRDCAKSLRMEAVDGVARCTCHLAPLAECPGKKGK